jgi:hypothetical protein
MCVVNERSSSLRCIGSAALTTSAVALIGLDYLVPMHSYSWDDDPALAGQVDADSALFLVVVSLGCLTLTALAAITLRPWARSPLGRFALAVTVVTAAFALGRLLQASMVCTG